MTATRKNSATQGTSVNETNPESNEQIELRKLQIENFQLAGELGYTQGKLLQSRRRMQSVFWTGYYLGLFVLVLIMLVQRKAMEDG